MSDAAHCKQTDVYIHQTYNKAAQRPKFFQRAATTTSRYLNMMTLVVKTNPVSFAQF